MLSLYRNWKIIYKYKNMMSEPAIIEDDFKLFEMITHACAFSILGFWVGATFLSLLPYPFLWILIPFSEAWKNIVLNNLEQKINVPSALINGASSKFKQV